MVPDVRKSVLRAGVYSTNESVFHSSQAAKTQHRLGAANCRFLDNWSARDIHRLSAFLRLVCGYAKMARSSSLGYAICIVPARRTRARNRVTFMNSPAMNNLNTLPIKEARSSHDWKRQPYALRELPVSMSGDKS